MDLGQMAIQMVVDFMEQMLMKFFVNFSVTMIHLPCFSRKPCEMALVGLVDIQEVVVDQVLVFKRLVLAVCLEVAFTWEVFPGHSADKRKSSLSHEFRT